MTLRQIERRCTLISNRLNRLNRREWTEQSSRLASECLTELALLDAQAELIRARAGERVQA